MRLRGEAHPQCRWPDEMVAEARELHDMGIGRKRISQALKVPMSTIRDWLRYWTRVEDDDHSGPQRER
jgi:hypothetical protein